MLPTAEGGKANAWLRQKNAGIYVRPRLFSPYVEEAKVRLFHIVLSQHTKQWIICMSLRPKRAEAVQEGRVSHFPPLGTVCTRL